MPTKYLDEEGLSHVVRRAKETFADKKELWNWQKTEKAGTVAFEPVPDSVLEPVVEFKFKETLPTEGDKGPENPSSIQGVQEVTIWQAGKNICNPPPYTTFTDNVYEANGITMTSNPDGSIVVNGTNENLEGATVRALVNSNNVSITGEPIGIGTWTVSGKPANAGYCALQTIYNNSQYGNSIAYNMATPTVGTIVVPSKFGFVIRIPSGYTANNDVWYPQMELGEVATEYEPPIQKRAYTTSFNGTYYGGTVDINTGLLTVTQFFYSFTGEETINVTDKGDGWKCFYYRRTDALADNSSDQAEETRKVCTHFPFVYNANQQSTHWYVQSGGNICLFSNQFADVDAFKGWLAVQKLNGTPVELTFNLAEPYTIQLTPTQIKSLASSEKYKPQINTIYSDQELIQIGYQKFSDSEGVVHRTGDETVGGIKTFQNTIETGSIGATQTSLLIRNPVVERGTPVPNNSSYSNIMFLDKEGEADNSANGRLGFIEIVSPSSGKTESMRMGCYKYDANEARKHVDVTVGYDENRIPYATAPETSEERTESSDIVTRGYADKIDSKVDSKVDSLKGNWFKTESSRSVSFVPVSDSPLHPTVNFLYTEALPAEGEKGPDNPSTIAGVSEIGISRCGKNIFQGCRNTNFQRQDNWWYSIELDNTSGDSKQYAMFYVKKTEAYNPDKNYCLVLELDECEPYIFGSSNTSAGQREQLYIKDRTQGVTLSGTGIYKYDLVHSNKTVTDVLIRCTQSVEIGESKSFKFRMAILQCSADEVDLDSYQYENTNDSYSIDLEDTYYGGTVDFATGQMTVTHVICELDGTENWATLNADGQTPLAYNSTTGYAYSYCYPYGITGHHSKYFPVLSENTSSFNILCTHAINAVNGIGDPGINNGTVDFTGIVLVGNNVRFSFPYSTVTEWKAFLAAQKTAGTPVRFAYRIETPFIVQLASAQIRSLTSDSYTSKLNIVYTDQKSVKVGYQRFIDEENVVHRTGAEDVEGFKVFSNAHTTDPNTSPNVTVSSLAVKHADLVKGTLPADKKLVNVQMLDSSGSDINHFGRLGSIEYESPKATDVSTRVYMRCWKFLPGDDPHVKDGVAVTVGYDSNGNEYASAPAISDERTDATDIVTRGWSISKSRIDELSL